MSIEIVFGLIVFGILVFILFIYLRNKEEKKYKRTFSSPIIKPIRHEDPIKQKTYWESLKEISPSKANEIEGLLNIDMSKLADRDVKEKVQMLERFSKSMGCSISQIKSTYLKEMEKFPARLIPQMIETTKKEMTNEINTFHVSRNNTCSALMIEWLNERLQNASKEETYWEFWKKQNPEKALSLVTMTKVDFTQMDDVNVKQTIASFERMAKVNNISDWSQIKVFFLKKFEELTKDLSNEEALNVFDSLISQEALYESISPKNTGSYYSKLWLEEYIKSKDITSLTQEETFRKEYREKLIQKIGSNANIPLFCEGYDSPIAHEIMYFMYLYLRNKEIKAKAEEQGLWNKYIQIIVDETEIITEKYCHAALQECIEYYNFPDKKVVTSSRCPSCGSRDIDDEDWEFGFKCFNCGYTWHAPLGKNLYL